MENLSFRLLTATDLTDDLWLQYALLRNAREIYDDPFFDPDFARVVSEVRDDVRFGCAFAGDELVAIWPLHLRPGNWARPIGGPFSDWHAPILKVGLQLSLEHFLSELGISGMTVFGLQPSWAETTANQDRIGANMSDIRQGAEEFLDQQAKMWPKHFKKMRRIYRNVERDFEAMELVYNDRRRECFETALALKQNQYRRTGYHDVLAPDWVRRLLDRLWDIEAPRLSLNLIRLEFDGKFAASELNLQSDTIMHGWLTSVSEDFLKYSPGNVLVQEALPHMSKAGLQYYDTGPGMDYYKRHYANCQFPVHVGTLKGAPSSSAMRNFAASWRWGEANLPSVAGQLMTRSRRRLDQVLITETTFKGRMKGVWDALATRQL